LTKYCLGSIPWLYGAKESAIHFHDFGLEQFLSEWSETSAGIYHDAFGLDGVDAFGAAARSSLSSSHPSWFHTPCYHLL
jgi:hypothetical protein